MLKQSSGKWLSAEFKGLICAHVPMETFTLMNILCIFIHFINIPFFFFDGYQSGLLFWQTLRYYTICHKRSFCGWTVLCTWRCYIRLWYEITASLAFLTPWMWNIKVKAFPECGSESDSFLRIIMSVQGLYVLRMWVKYCSKLHEQMERYTIVCKCFGTPSPIEFFFSFLKTFLQMLMHSCWCCCFGGFFHWKCTVEKMWKHLGIFPFVRSQNLMTHYID